MSKLVFVAMILVLSQVGFAKNKKEKPKSDGLSTNFVFDGSSLNGKYNYAFESNAAVEGEKKINSLLEPRYEFKDRIRDEKDRN